ncbi:MAG TPA: antitoxin MazE-like protein [Chloroflexota bacterium]|nr:antitoxin MazE-like protein [Chloroflexota bacterium]
MRVIQMPSSSRSKSSAERVRRYRRRMRDRGIRAIQIWVPEVRAPSFREAHRQSLAVATSARAKEEQDFIDAVSEWPPSSDVTRTSFD